MRNKFQLKVTYEADLATIKSVEIQSFDEIGAYHRLVGQGVFTSQEKAGVGVALLSSLSQRGVRYAYGIRSDMEKPSVTGFSLRETMQIASGLIRENFLERGMEDELTGDYEYEYGM